MTFSAYERKYARAYGAILSASVFALAGCNPDADHDLQTAQAAFPSEISCGVETQSEFLDAVTLLHSFEYVDTFNRFSAMIEREPSCAMAYWGAAMSIWHPLWAPPSQAQLEQGAQYLAQTDSLNRSAKEMALIGAAKQFFSDTDLSTNKIRARAFTDAMAQASAAYPDDYEIKIFYALGMLSAADPFDKTYVSQHKAGAMLKELKEDHPQHPGILHYIIHSYDFPGLAELALDEAKLYAQSARNSTHAQHMPSHIFTRLGLWELSIASNHDSTASAAEFTRRANLPGHYDEGLHGIDYLMYALLQTARDDEAKELLDELSGIKKTDTENFKVAFTYAASPARYVLERRAWEEAAELMLLRPDFRWDEFGWAQSIHYFARGIGAARSGRLEQAKDELALIGALQDKLPDSLTPYLRVEVQVQADIVQSWILLAEGDAQSALQLAHEAAELEDSIDKHPVTPGEVLPARELYADMLLETGAAAAALVEYQHVLTMSPNRLNALMGAARSATSIGDEGASKAYLDIIDGQTRFGGGTRL